jgi:PAS domain S-box-containing protein
VDAVRTATPAYLQWCLADAGPSTQPMRLAGDASCAQPAAAPQLAHHHLVDLGDRRWTLELRALPAQVPAGLSWDSWLFAAAGLLGTAVLGALLLTVTGRTRRIEMAVNERTADLRHEAAERERTEAALRDSEQRLRTIGTQLPIGVVTMAVDGSILESNPRMRKMVGHAAPALGTYTIADLAHPDDQPELRRQLVELAEGRLPLLRQRLRLVHRDGAEFWVQAGLSLLRTQGLQPRQLLGVFEDITEHLRLADAERARDVAESANQAKSEFLSRMSHELRTPLNAMLGFSQLLEMDQRPVLSGHQGQWVGQIQQAGWHLLHMINDTLDLSRIESGAIRLDIESVALEPLLRASVALVQPDAQRRGLTLTLSLAPDALRVVGDATRIKQIVTNLLSNAVKYNVDGGHILLATRHCPDNMVDLTVQDSGIGMTDAQLAALFQPFNRLGRERGSVEGTGIGLVIARRLTELMGGQLRVTSLAGHGSTFVFNLPAAPEGGVLPEPAAFGLAQEPAYHRRRVLYIEDNETNAEVMRGVLAQRPQVEMQLCTSGLDGLAAAKQTRPSLVMLDMHLPDVDGLELLRHLRDDPDTQDIPVVVVSADATTQRIELAFAEGASDYVTKPVNVQPFLALLDRLLGEQETQFG